MISTYFCCETKRREQVRTTIGPEGQPLLNGIDYLEVEPGQTVLKVYFVNAFAAVPSASDLTIENVTIEGGERIKDIRVAGPFDLQDNVLTVGVNTRGDFSTYTLRIVKKDELGNISGPPDGFDPILSSVDFSFKVNCPSEFDCRSKRICPPEQQVQPEIDYLAKDYGSFRQLMLDRMAAVMPDWKERNPADLGVALVELLAYVGDHLSYRQDAVATEAYLGTARKRVSVRRHARLVDYFMQDGCNARVWVQVQVIGDNVPLPKQAQLMTSMSERSVRIEPLSAEYEQALAMRPEVFETMHDAVLFSAHNEMQFYTWGDERCCLPKGATRATLGDDANDRLRLRTGDVLIFEEVRGPRNGNPADADPTHRHAVRLTRVAPSGDDDSKTDQSTGQAIVEIEWDAEDSLPFPLCLWKIKDPEGKEHPVSVARGNIVLADHGQTIPQEELGPVPSSPARSIVKNNDDPCKEKNIVPLPLRFHPSLKERPLTQAVPYDPTASAGAAMRWKMEDALPAITLDSKTWTPRRDLLNSGPDATEFVIEAESDGTAYPRFGDDEHGKRPESDIIFTATYRIGNGTSGNVGAETLAHIVTDTQGITSVRNPMPAKGGVEPESIEHVRQSAPYAFRTQERAVTPEDYAAVAERHPGVQRAAAIFRWTGSWYTVFVTVDRIGGLAVDEEFKKEMRKHLEKYRMAGHDVEVDGPRYVSLEIEMLVCVKPDYFRSDVKEALLQVFNNVVLPDGRRGVFHPDNFTFGQAVYLSPLYAAAQAIDGVSSVQVTTFQRQGRNSNKALNAGKLILGRREIARLDNDPNFPEHGVFRLDMKGGK